MLYYLPFKPFSNMGKISKNKKGQKYKTVKEIHLGLLTVQNTHDH